MKIFSALLALFLTSVFFISCQKELNFVDSQGTLKKDSTSNDCLPAVLNGVYKVDSLLSLDNYIEVQVDVTFPGHYEIKSDTINGYSFYGAGDFASTGINTARIYGFGNPDSAMVNTFTLSYTNNTGICRFDVEVQPSGNTLGDAVYTLGGAGTNCTGFSTNGDYITGVSTSSLSNYVTITVDVTTPGTYTITSTSNNNVTFSGTGVFTQTGTQSVNLYSSGTPADPGSFDFAVSAQGSTCSFPLTFGGTITCELNGVFTSFNVAATAGLTNSSGNSILSIDGSSSNSGIPSINLQIVNHSAPIGLGTFDVNQNASGIEVNCNYLDPMSMNYFNGTDPANQSQSPGFTIVLTNLTGTSCSGTFEGVIKDNAGAGPGVITVTRGYYNVPKF